MVPRAAAVSHDGPQVVVDPAGVYMRVTRLHDGSLLGGYAAGDGSNKVLRVAKSTDEGTSWKVIGAVDSQPSVSHDLDNAFPLQLPGGRIVFAFRNHDLDGNKKPTYFRLTVCYSDDGGVSWKYLSQIDERAKNGVNGLWEPFLRNARDGSLQAYYSSENSGGDQDNLMRISRDGGKTWSGPRPVSGVDRDGTRDGMTGVAEVNDNGRLICVFENTEAGYFTVDAVYSDDDGLTWQQGNRQRIYTAANRREAGAPSVINVGDTLVVDFMTNENTNTPQLDGGQMKVVTSTDGGKSWGGATVTGEAGSHWPGMVALNNNGFLALYSQNGHGLVSQKYRV
ncbi:glycoside hydrolase family 93 protein [Akanthomyces lecanii RCEF 1005]|uniref:Glycoside hydrolase family 93 protein n=1 Tax=Akanthomyces lecanii RCEF 1005 TaxID=1081108 RepID=A0A168CWI7_CORDF|nr:glycoside hydrolase family 93 protein [Akanthomyces lecanii RCEF 1005]